MVKGNNLFVFSCIYIIHFQISTWQPTNFVTYPYFLICPIIQFCLPNMPQARKHIMNERNMTFAPNVHIHTLYKYSQNLTYISKKEKISQTLRYNQLCMRTGKPREKEDQRMVIVIERLREMIISKNESDKNYWCSKMK